MTQKKFCIYATTAVGVAGGVILVPAIGLLSLGLPLLMGLFGKKMAEVSGLDDTDGIGYREKSESNKLDYAARDEPQLFTQVRAENRTAHRNQGGLNGARGSLRNEAYFRRHRR